ncbi:MAG: UbiA family prenyltransferase [Myxococcota bacterium]
MSKKPKRRGPETGAAPEKSASKRGRSKRSVSNNVASNNVASKKYTSKKLASKRASSEKDASEPKESTASPNHTSSPTHRSALGRWWFALKPASWPKLLVPALLGQSLGFYHAHYEADADELRLSLVSWPAIGLGLAFTLLLLIYIVCLNDVGDRVVDAQKRKMFPKSSKKTLFDGVLTARALGTVGILAGAGVVSVMVVAGVVLERSLAWAYGLLALLVFLAYTFPPLKLNYRGGGEFLEMLSVGFLLPLAHAYLQGGALWPRHAVAVLGGFTLLALASAVASGLSDERSDRAAGKRTVASRYGNRAARFSVEVLAAGGAIFWIAIGGWVEPELAWALVPGGLVVFFFLWSLVVHSKRAKTDAFSAQRAYKGFLHRGIWLSGTVVAFLLPISD